MGWFWETEVETNDIQGSIKSLQIKPLEFDTLWGNYPSSRREIDHYDKSLDDYCAINLSESFLKSDVAMKSFKGTRCWGKCPNKKHYREHAIRAQEFADWIKLKPFPGCPDAQSFVGKYFRDKIDGKKGIVFFKDYWLDGDVRSGDHIDLWDGLGIDELASQTFFENILTNSLNMSWDGLYSSKNLSKEVLFWEIE